MSRRLAGVLGPVVTPFDAREELDVAAFEHNLRAHLQAGLDGVLICGSTGEAALLDEVERRRLTESARSVVPAEAWLLVGTGALGSPAALYLAAAGVGRLGLVDADTVDASNLHRQILHGESWLGKPKLESAASRLREVNPHVTVEAHPVRFAPDNALQIAASYDVIVDGSDNFPTRYLLDAAVITMPAYFNHNQIEATRQAGELAGFEVL